MKTNKLKVLVFLVLTFPFYGSVRYEDRLENTSTYFPFPGFHFCTNSGHLDSLMRDEKDSIPVYQFLPLKLSDSLFALLTLEEHLIHALNYPEQYRQICSLYPIDSLAQQKIHAYFSNDWGERSLSKRQWKALKENRTAVIELIKDCLKSDIRTDNRLKEVIIELNATECIPELIDRVTRDKQPDTYHLTCLLKLINYNNPALLEGTEYAKFYAGDYSDRIKSLPKTTERTEKTLILAETFYKSTFD